MQYTKANPWPEPQQEAQCWLSIMYHVYVLLVFDSFSKTAIIAMQDENNDKETHDSEFLTILILTIRQFQSMFQIMTSPDVLDPV